jgi:phenylacetate-CoA ligase
MVRLSPEHCREGRGLHVIDEVMGRTTDFVVRADGTVMHALSVIYVLRGEETISRFKFIQHSLQDSEVLIVPGPDFGTEVIAKVEHGLRDRLGPDVRINFRVVDAIRAEASGKYRYVVSEVRV